MSDLLPVAQNLADVFFRLAARQHQLMPATGAAQAEVHTAAQYEPLLCAAGVLLLHDEDIADLYVQWFYLLPSHACIYWSRNWGDLMHQFLPEGLHPQPEGYTKEELLLAMQQRKILQAPAIKCDERHDLHIALGCCAGVMPRAEAARGILGGETRDIAILSRVGRPVCFTVMGFAPDGTALLSRRSAQEAALEQIFREKRPGDILPAVVTGLAPFGAFCDIGCGAVGLLGLRNLCVSRLTHPRELLRVGQQLPVLIQSLDPARRRVGLTLRELLGTWQENAARFRAGQTVTGIACGKTDYGVFIALTPNLCGLAERDDTLEPGQPVCVYIKAIHPETLKLKLTVLHRLDTVPPQPLRFTKTEGRLDVWRYGSRENAKIVTVF